MHTIETQIEIDATAESVWSLLADFSGYSRWNPFIRSIEGRLEIGGKLNAFLKPPGTRGMRFRPVLLAAEANRELRWKGRLLLPGLFDGEHYFIINRRPDGGVVFRQGETFSGILVPLLRRSLDDATRRGFIAMNEALKHEAEKGERG
ncbi:MAG: SRPBCC domain-containing protein [Smithellaceae bacterium]|nr:SRPBCC domain-containing protein [Smithellaceae bacterium]